MTLRRLAAASAALLAAGVVLSVGVSGGTASPAAAVAGGGAPGYCPTAEGVTVVVDFQELGGGIVVRCAPGPVVPGYTGLDALQDAGFTPTGVRRYGLAFICRIAGKPTADQDLPIQGDPHYHEACLDTPPQLAFWGYWYAPNGEDWSYSQTAAISRDAIRGGFEGWSFSLNHAPGEVPPPGIAPKRPPHAPPTSPPPSTPPTHRPPTHRPPTPTHEPPSDPPATHRAPQHEGGGSPGTGVPPTTPTATATTRPAAGPGAGGGGRGSSGGAPDTPTSPGATSPPPSPIADPVAVGLNAAGERVTGELPGAAEPADGSARTTVVGLGVVALLAVGGGVAAWRRRAARE